MNTNTIQSTNGHKPPKATDPAPSLEVLKQRRADIKKNLAAKEKSLTAKRTKLDNATKARTKAGQEFDQTKAERDAMRDELAKLDDAIDAKIRQVGS